MKKLLFFIFIVLYYNGCGGEESVVDNTTVATYKNNEVIMEKNKKYKVYNGDKIVKISSSPQIKIEADLEKNISYATLLSGAAKIVRTK